MECSEFAKTFLADKGDKVLLDVRELDEVALGKVKQAKNIPLSQLMTRFNELSKDSKIYIYCRSGKRAQSAKEILNGAGYLNVFSAVNGGYDELACLFPG